jgi:hypothetical protein
MKIIITESQYQNLTEEKLREFLYGFWDNQKKHGENPSLDDMLFRVLDIKKETRNDYGIIRPIWYEYNGGYEVLENKIKNEIDTKEYTLIEPEFNLETKIKVVHLERTGDFIEIMVDVDPRGTIDFHGYDDETEEEYMVNDTIDAAYQEALSNYETGDFFGMIRSVVYDFFYNLLEKYGIPIDVDIDLQEIYGAPYGINENTQKPTRKSDILIQMWDKEKEEKGYATFDPDVLKYFGISTHNNRKDIVMYEEFFTDYIGGEEKIMEIINHISINTFHTKDFPEKIVGGYDFEWRISDVYVRDGNIYLSAQVSEGGMVSLMNGKTERLDDAIADSDVGWEIQNEVESVIFDCMDYLIYSRTAMTVTVNYVEI